MAKALPRTIGVRRDKKSTAIHSEVVQMIQAIAELENKSFSYVNAEIIYAFFGLRVTDGKKTRRTR